MQKSTSGCTLAGQLCLSPLGSLTHLWVSWLGPDIAGRLCFKRSACRLARWLSHVSLILLYPLVSWDIFFSQWWQRNKKASQVEQVHFNLLVKSHLLTFCLASKLHNETLSQDFGHSTGSEYFWTVFQSLVALPSLLAGSISWPLAPSWDLRPVLPDCCCPLYLLFCPVRL